MNIGERSHCDYDAPIAVSLFLTIVIYNSDLSGSPHSLVLDSNKESLVLLYLLVFHDYNSHASAIVASVYSYVSSEFHEV